MLRRVVIIPPAIRSLPDVQERHHPINTRFTVGGEKASSLGYSRGVERVVTTLRRLLFSSPVVDSRAQLEMPETVFLVPRIDTGGERRCCNPT